MKTENGNLGKVGDDKCPQTTQRAREAGEETNPASLEQDPYCCESCKYGAGRQLEELRVKYDTLRNFSKDQANALEAAEVENKGLIAHVRGDMRQNEELRKENKALRESMANVAAALPPVRLQMAAAILNGIMACAKDYGDAKSQEARVALAIEYADELLKQTGKGAGA